ncbi:MAG: 3-hydroxyacyl-CoA dehydrogenase family protein [Thermoplasmata archaeon]|nr:3-hydroxyacyl-CoA dehydrogenase family protein [Thermoplasmata archaeon]
MSATGDPPSPDPPPIAWRRLFVVGAGIMGAGVAAQCALAGYQVELEDTTAEFVERGAREAKRALEGQVTHGGLPAAARDEALARLTTVVGLASVGTADLIIEAVPESLPLKRRVFRELEESASPQAAMATNTSSLPIAAIGSEMRDPGRLIGIHFFNPVLRMPLVELIAGRQTRPGLREQADSFVRSLGKTVVASQDSPGFVTSRAVALLLNEAAWMLSQGVATRDDIDTAYKLGFHHPMGPFELADMVGLDTAVAILDVLWDGFQDPKYKACPLLRTMVSSGKLGRKSGEGFYPYPPKGGPAKSSA